MVMLEKCGMSRNEKGLTEAIDTIRELKAEFWSDIKVPGTGEELNQELEKAGRVADLFELAELMCMDARQRNESCGGHFREEYKTEEGEARRDDENFTNVTVWEYKGEDAEPVAHTEELEFENVELTQRSYK
jgi:succinate dehydrogenase / fumarate reductase flavoprotein subunit